MKPYVVKKVRPVVKRSPAPPPQKPVVVNGFAALQEEEEKVEKEPVKELCVKMGVLELGIAAYRPTSNQRPRDRLTKPEWLLKRAEKLTISRSGSARQRGVGSMTRQQVKKVKLAKRKKKDDSLARKRVVVEKKIVRVDEERALMKASQLEAMMPPMEIEDEVDCCC